jgi:hypothetical protein
VVIERKGRTAVPTYTLHTVSANNKHNLYVLNIRPSQSMTRLTSGYQVKVSGSLLAFANLPGAIPEMNVEKIQLLARPAASAGATVAAATTAKSGLAASVAAATTQEGTAPADVRILFVILSACNGQYPAGPTQQVSAAGATLAAS